MADFIDRQAAIDTVSEWLGGVFGVYKTDDAIGVFRKLRQLPSAQPEQHWIPCSERLPVNDGWQIVTILDGRGDTPYRYTDFGLYLDKAECWIIDAELRKDVIAWMPLPEPLRGEEDERSQRN